jgi:hypothetical protein
MSYFGRDLAWKFKKHVLKPWASEYRTSYIFYQRYLFQWLKYDLSFQNHCCAGSTLWPLQKCLHYIIVEFPLHHSFYPPNPNSWNSFKRSRVPFNIWPLHVNQSWSSAELMHRQEHIQVILFINEFQSKYINLLYCAHKNNLYKYIFEQTLNRHLL